MTNIPILNTISEIAEKYDAWFCDIWGVLHNGERVFGKAIEACQAYMKSGGSVILISNSPRPSFSVKHQFDMLGLPHNAYHAIVTSGDVTRGLIKNHAHLSLFHLGPERDVPLFEDISTQSTSAEKAEVLLCTGLFDDETETPDDYLDMLTQFAKRDVPMICANPDIQVERGDTLIYCAGALAEVYKRMNGRVLFAGKPHAPIYQEAQKQLEVLIHKALPQNKVLCVGDGIHTDIEGAHRNGFDVLYIASRLHTHKCNQNLTQKDVSTLFRDSSFSPVAAQIGLKW